MNAIREATSMNGVKAALALVCGLAASSEAAGFFGFVAPAEDPDAIAAVLRLRVRPQRDGVAGTIVDCLVLPACAAAETPPPECAVVQPCPSRGARFGLRAGTVQDPELPALEFFSGEIVLADGTTCAAEGHAWAVKAGKKTRKRAALRGRFTCPAASGAEDLEFFFWRKGYQPKFDGD